MPRKNTKLKKTDNQPVLTNENLILIAIKAEIAKQLKELATARQISVSDMVEVMLRNMSSSRKNIELDTKFRFGKYYGLTAEQVIRSDIRYAIWMRDKLEDVHFDEQCLALIEQIDNAGI
jgi:plasmid maintenance system antidote protein VapI